MNWVRHSSGALLFHKFFAREASFNEVTQRRRNNQAGETETKQEKILNDF